MGFLLNTVILLVFYPSRSACSPSPPAPMWPQAFSSSTRSIITFANATDKNYTSHGYMIYDYGIKAQLQVTQNTYPILECTNAADALGIPYNETGPCYGYNPSPTHLLGDQYWVSFPHATHSGSSHSGQSCCKESNTGTVKPTWLQTAVYKGRELYVSQFIPKGVMTDVWLVEGEAPNIYYELPRASNSNQDQNETSVPVACQMFSWGPSYSNLIMEWDLGTFDAGPVNRELLKLPANCKESCQNTKSR